MSGFAPKRFGSYILTDVLGEGGAGRVFRGYRSASDIKVPYAIKILLEKNLANLRYLNQFRDEALLASRLKHANIGSFIEFFEFHGKNAIVLEFIEGISLNKFIGTGTTKEERMALHHSLFIASQILEGLHYLQRHDVTHGDLSPGNVMIDREGQAKLIDFGLAKLQREIDAPTSKFVQASLAYMSPQRLYERKISASDDLFAFGIILWELLTGERYHADRSFLAICKTLENFTPRDPRTVVPELSEDVALFVIGCLNAEKPTGFRSVGDARDGLRSVLARNSIFPDIDKFRSYLHERFGKDFQTFESETKQQGEVCARASKDEATQVLTASDVNAPLASDLAVTTSDVPKQTSAATKTSSRDIPPVSRPIGLPPSARLSASKTVDLPPQARMSSRTTYAIAGSACLAVVVMFGFILSNGGPERAPATAMAKRTTIPVVGRGSKPMVEKPKAAETPALKMIMITSSPIGAVVYRDRVMVGTTPFKMPAQESKGAFAFQKEGFGDIWVEAEPDVRSISVDFDTRAFATEKF